MNLLNYLSILCDISLIFYFTNLFIEKKIKISVQSILSLTLCSLLLFLLSLYTFLFPTIIIQCLSIIILSFLIFISYKTTFLSTIIIAQLYVITSITIKEVLLFLFSNINPLVLSIISTILFFILLNILNHKMNMKSIIPLDSYMVACILFFCYLFISILFYMNNDFYFSSNEKILLILFLTILLIVLYWFIIQNQNLNFENKSLKYTNRQFLSYEAKDMDYELRKLKHSMKNQLIAIEYLLEDGQYKEAQKLIKKNVNNPALKKIIKTKNNVLNVVLNYYIQAYEDIKFDSIIQIDTLPLDPYAIIMILGNILDNAVEAVSLLSDKTIFIQIIENDTDVFITIENYYVHNLKYENQQLVTNKADTLFHGIGLAQVKEYIHKYNGSIDIDIDEDKKLFIVNVRLLKDER